MVAASKGYDQEIERLNPKVLLLTGNQKKGQPL
jgi:hypothetical protein